MLMLYILSLRIRPINNKGKALYKTLFFYIKTNLKGNIVEFKRNDKVIAKSGRVFIVVKDTDINSPNVELQTMLSGKWIKTITTKNKLTKKD